MKASIIKSIFTLTISVILFSCNRSTPAPTSNNSEYSVDITFDGLLRKCPQYGGAASDEGTLLGSCIFHGDDLSIGCGSNNVYNTSASNGFNFSFNVNNVTHAGIYTFREETTEGTVGVQEIDITRYSSENGGIIEGTFYATVYEKPSGCFSYIPKIVTATFKVKRVNL